MSDWRLANAVARLGEMGVVSGTALDAVLVRRLQLGDAGGHMRRAMARFPIPGVADAVLERFFRPEGLAPGQRFASIPMPTQRMSLAREQITVLAAFVEVALAREGHDGPVGINLLTKIQMPNLDLLYGAMLAGVDYVVMGAGIPREIPVALDALTNHEPASLKLDLEDAAPGDVEELRIDPATHWAGAAPPALRRPQFLAIVASNTLATMLGKKAARRVDGFVVEGPTAGGHNAPPRDRAVSPTTGEPVYGERDVVDLEGIRALGLPFWVAGGAGWPERLAEALRAGAAGIQVGTLFAYCDESGISGDLRRSVLESVVRGEAQVRTDGRASPTGFPFKVVTWDGDPAAGVARTRVCDLGYLRSPYRRGDGTIGYRCASEPEDQFVAKGGGAEETPGRKCLCNGLFSSVGLGQRREGGAVEPPLVTSGDDLARLAEFLGGRTHYSAADAVRWLLAGAAA
ncbi:MAG TPA: nitronate monooxygenase [Anaeromyxobacteraceae bacterium]|nr:nitronate monooxygenase [Anaeromyxobacteraceae bacterium]